METCGGGVEAATSRGELAARVRFCSVKHEILDQYVQELSAKIKQDLEADLEAKVNVKVKENMSWMLKKLRDTNPGLKFDITDLCATASSDQDDNGTPFTQGGTDS
ncbi:hypothetical protein OROMI_029728 [Orobanche minor]